MRNDSPLTLRVLIERGAGRPRRGDVAVSAPSTPAVPPTDTTPATAAEQTNPPTDTTPPRPNDNPLTPGLPVKRGVKRPRQSDIAASTLAVPPLTNTTPATTDKQTPNDDPLTSGVPVKRGVRRPRRGDVAASVPPTPDAPPTNMAPATAATQTNTTPATTAKPTPNASPLTPGVPIKRGVGTPRRSDVAALAPSTPAASPPTDTTPAAAAKQMNPPTDTTPVTTTKQTSNARALTPGVPVKRGVERPRRSDDTALSPSMPAAPPTDTHLATTTKQTEMTSTTAAAQTNTTPATTAKQMPNASPNDNPLTPGVPVKWGVGRLRRNDATPPTNSAPATTAKQTPNDGVPVKRGVGLPRRSDVAASAPSTPNAPANRAAATRQTRQQTGSLPVAPPSAAAAPALNGNNTSPLSSVNSPHTTKDRFQLPWNQLTSEELMRVRRKAKKSYTWVPSVGMIIRELESLGRGPSNKHLFRQQWEGKRDVIIGPEKGGIGRFKPKRGKPSKSENREAILTRSKVQNPARNQEKKKFLRKYDSDDEGSSSSGTNYSIPSDSESDSPQTPIQASASASVAPATFPVKRRLGKPKRYGKAGVVKADWHAAPPAVPVTPASASAPALPAQPSAPTLAAAVSTPAPAPPPPAPASAPVPPTRGDDILLDRRPFGTGKKGDLLLPLFSEQEIKVVRNRNKRSNHWVPPWITLERELKTLGRTVPPEVRRQAAIKFGHEQDAVIKKSPEKEDSQDAGQGGTSGPVNILRLFDDLMEAHPPHKMPIHDTTATPIRYDLVSHQSYKHPENVANQLLPRYPPLQL
ncbi:hypothetical protein BDD12DRAFT_480187 [Trichophaea hybrida]|nr:hypothetical protein BDD12DRAFT_480187 [Trichophaea hybrida]